MKKKDEALKLLLIALWNEYNKNLLGIYAPAFKTYCMATYRLLRYESVDLAHITKRSRKPDLKYDINNVQLLCRAKHQEQEGTDKDYRPDGFKQYIKQIKILWE